MTWALDWRLKVAGGLLLALAGAALLFRVDPRVSTLLPQCPLHLLTGLHCPGCGSTRALHLLLHGDWQGAMKMNSFMVLSLPLVGGLIAVEASGRSTSRLVPAWAIWSYFVVVLLYTLARNLPWPPFSALAPH